MKTRRRGVSALIEHRRQDDWTCTPCICGESGCSGGCDVLAGERLPKQRPQYEEHPDHNTEEHLGARFPHQGEEAGSIVFHSSSNMSEIKNDNNEARATASAAAKVSEDLSIKDAEILRLIEERRSTPKEEKQRLKEVIKCIKMYQRQKRMKTANGYPGNQISKEECTHHKDKKRERGMHHISERNCRCLWRIPQKTLRRQRER